MEEVGGQGEGGGGVNELGTETTGTGILGILGQGPGVQYRIHGRWIYLKIKT